MRYFIIVALLVLSGCVSQPLPDGFKSSDDIDTVDAAKTRISLGLTYLKNGNYSQAKFNLDKALQFAPRLADAHYSLAYYYQVVGENEMAEESYQDALDLAPGNPDIANTYGAFLCQQGKYTKAKEYFLKAVNSDNYISTAETYENLALCSQSQGQISDAITYLQQAINHQPTRGKSLLLLTQLLVSEARWPEAAQALKRYEKTSRVNPETLWLSYKIQQALGNADVANGYGDMLVRMYPGHANTKQYLLKRYRKEPKAPATAVVEASPLVVEETKTVVVEAPEKNISEQVQAANNKTISETDAPLESVTDAEEAMQQVASDIEDNEPVAESVQQSNPEDTEMKTIVEEARQEVSTPKETLPVAENQVTEDSVSDAEQAEVVSQSEDIQSDLTEPETISEQTVSLSEEEVAYHIVQKGENLYRISLLYNVKMKRLIEWNQLQDASSIYIGKKLVVVDPQTVE